MTDQTPSPKTLPLPVMLLGIVLLVAGVLVARYALGPHESASSGELPAHYLQPGKPITGFHLLDDNQQPFDTNRFKGKWTFMFFGYTNCPDVCPTSMLVMKSVWAQLPFKVKSAPALQMVFVSVDPDRDTLTRLKSFVTFYNPDFLGVTGKADQIDVLTKQVGVLYGFDDDPDNHSYTVQHSAQIILVDPTGQMRAVFSPPHKAEDLVHSFIQIRNYYLKVNS